MEGIIGRFHTFITISIKGEHPYLFHALFIKITPVVYHLLHVDHDECQYIIHKKRSNKCILVSDKGETSP